MSTMDICELTHEQLADSLERKAAKRQTITYNNLATELGLLPVNNMFPNHPLKHFFEQLDAIDSVELRPFRTALVVQKATGQPGKGFFESLSVLRRIEISKGSQTQLWKTEIEELFAYYDPQREKCSITIQLSHAQTQRLDGLLPLYGRTAEDLIEQSFTEMLARLEHDYRGVAESDAAATRGEFFTHEEVKEHLDKILAGED